MTAGLYCARGMKSLLIEIGMPGGQAANTDNKNYPGFPQGVGIELMQKFMEHH